MIVLGIETSCDETAAAIFDGKQLLANCVITQEIHRKYGGVVPELASREHIRYIVSIVEEAFSEARLCWNDISAVAVTRGPGLVGSLLVGISYAKAAAFARNIPIVGVNHIEGHLWAPLFEYTDIKPPFIGLIISGGHTQLWLVQDFGYYKLLGQTLDDAVGESFDKVAQMLDLGYPGGPQIDRLSRIGNSEFHSFPHVGLKGDTYNFSYSGLKTSVLYYLKKLNRNEIITHKADIAASFQKAALDVLVEKSIRAAQVYSVSRIVLGGGVAANKTLQEKMHRAETENNVQVYIPSSRFCTDNAAMIALVGYRLLQSGHSDNFSFSAEPSLKLV